MSRSWSFAIDRGGTFTDIAAYSSDGLQRTVKLLSEAAGRYADPALEGIGRILAQEGGTVSSVRMDTTVATNALLERKGARVALVTTRGFGDALRIGYQARPEIFFARHIQLPSMLYEAVVEIQERIGAQGEVLVPLDDGEALQALHGLHEKGFDSLAILLMHGWAYPDHELRLAAIARRAGFEQVFVFSGH